MIGIVLLTLGALNAALAMTVETCTGGSADSLYGGWLTLFLYLLGGAMLLHSPPRPLALVTLVPAAAVALWHSWFAIRFALAYWVDGISACFAMSGSFEPRYAGEAMDGGEPLLTALWCALSLMFWIGIVAAYRQRRHREL